MAAHQQLVARSPGHRPRFRWRPLLVALVAGVALVAADSPGPSAHRVAALATKLEHWFSCQRLTIQQQQQQQIASATTQQPNVISKSSDDKSRAQEQQQHQRRSGCPPHFDGHLCWPASAAEASVALPCPRLSWLPKQQSTKEIDLNSVINFSSQLANLTPTSISNQLVAELVANSSRSITLLALDGRREPATGLMAPISSAAETEARVARRRCQLEAPADALNLDAAQWQVDADYTNCAHGAAAASVADPTDEWIKLNQQEDERLFRSLAEELDRIEGTIDPYSDPDLLEQWTICIREIMRHSEQSGAAAAEPQTNLTCPIIFDGWRCWPATRAGDTAYVSCPSNQPGFSAERKAHKICTLDGTWYRHPMTNRFWSNYTTCVDTVDLAFRTKILNLYVIGNLISLVALTASLIIFISFKSLNCTRVSIHKNLFLSFIANNLMWIIWYTCVVNDADLLQSNPLECQLWHILLHYFLVSNYFWMFCEGLYLHTLLVVAFVSEDKILKWFYLLGWLTPVPITVAYAYTRSYDEYYTNFCWMEESPHNLILMAPIGISLLLNLIFLINIVRVLVTKLRANNSPDTHQTRKAVRATLILIPLLGLHYMLTPFRPEAKSEWEVYYEIIAAVCTSFQGLCVALLFCFCNGEVMAAINRKLKDTFGLKQHGGGGRNGTSNNNCQYDDCTKRRQSQARLLRDRSNTLTTTCGPAGGLLTPPLHQTTSIQTNDFGLDAKTCTMILPSSAAGANGDCRSIDQQRGSIESAATTIVTNSTSILPSSAIAHSSGTSSGDSNCSSLMNTVPASPIQVAAAKNGSILTSLSSYQQVVESGSLIASAKPNGVSTSVVSKRQLDIGRPFELDEAVNLLAEQEHNGAALAPKTGETDSPGERRLSPSTTITMP